MCRFRVLFNDFSFFVESNKPKDLGYCPFSVHSERVRDLTYKIVASISCWRLALLFDVRVEHFQLSVSGQTSFVFLWVVDFNRSKAFSDIICHVERAVHF